jgi:hypothetical protein
MAFKIFKYRWHKISVFVLLIILVLITVLAFLINRYWQPVLEKKIREVVLKSSDGLYKVDFSSAELHVIRGTLVFNDVVLKPDTAVYNARKKLGLAPNNLVELRVKRLTLAHIHPFRLYFKQRLDIDAIILKQPSLEVSYRLNHARDTSLKSTRTAWEKISKSLHSIHVDSILLGDVKFKYEDYSGNKVAVSELKEMNLSGRDLLIDSATQTDKSRLLYFKEIVAEVNNYTSKTANGLYNYKINSIKFSTKTSQLKIRGIAINPVNSAAFFSKTSHERFNVRLDSLEVNNFDYLNYHEYRWLHAGRVVLASGALHILANPNNYPDDGADKVKSFPSVALFKTNTDLTIDTLLLKNMDIVYSEFNKKSNETGPVSFNNTTGRLLNITTNAAALQKNHFSKMQLTTYFNKWGKLDLQMVFNLTDPAHAFTIKGRLGAMDLKVLNPTVMPLGMVKVNTGNLTEFSFDIKANQYKSVATVGLLYNKLNISILKQDTILDKLKKRPIASLFANIFIVKHDNPDGQGQQPRTASFTFARTPDMPFFKFLWQTLLTGIKPCAGLNKQKQDATVELIKQQAINKENRKVKKAQRKARRAERQKEREEKASAAI